MAGFITQPGSGGESTTSVVTVTELPAAGSATVVYRLRTAGGELTGYYAWDASASAYTMLPTLDQVQDVVTDRVRIRLSSALTVYVSSSGNDSNDGLTAGTPKATLQAAWNLLACCYDLGGQTVTIQLADGTYPAGLVAAGRLMGQGPSIIIRGNVSTPANVTVNSSTSSTFRSEGGADITVQALTMTNTSGLGLTGCVYTTNAGRVAVGSGCVFGAAGTVSHLYADSSGLIDLAGNYSITGSAAIHFCTTRSGIIKRFAAAVAITLSGTPAFIQFASADVTGVLSAGIVSFTGSATGTRYSASTNGVIITGGMGANFFPGSVAGSAAGGVYA